MRLVGIAALLIGGLARAAQGQTVAWSVEGDSAAANGIEETVRRLGTSVDRWTVNLVRRALDDVPGARGSEIKGAVYEGMIRRIVVSTWTDRGRLTTEYQFDRDALVLVVQTMEPFDDDRGAALIRDGRSLAWEQRYYLTDERIRCRKSRGKGIPAAELAATLVIRARAARDIVRRSAETRK